nr:YhcH/YjgK/YiaL family protein [uncultured Bacteroides sp.]
MIVSNLKNVQRIEKLHPLFRVLFDCVKTHDLLHSDLGRIEISGDNLFINNLNLDCIESAMQILEVHRDYIDVHILLNGVETIGWKDFEDAPQEIKPYEKEGNCAQYSDVPTTFVTLYPGQFVVVYPEDAHIPIIGKGKIRKLVAKVKL